MQGSPLEQDLAQEHRLPRGPGGAFCFAQQVDGHSGRSRVRVGSSSVQQRASQQCPGAEAASDLERAIEVSGSSAAPIQSGLQAAQATEDVDQLRHVVRLRRASRLECGERPLVVPPRFHFSAPGLLHPAQEAVGPGQVHEVRPTDGVRGGFGEEVAGRRVVAQRGVDGPATRQDAPAQPQVRYRPAGGRQRQGPLEAVARLLVPPHQVQHPARVVQRVGPRLRVDQFGVPGGLHRENFVVDVQGVQQTILILEAEALIVPSREVRR